MKKVRFGMGLFLVLLGAASVLPARSEEDFSTAEEKAQRAHERSMSDVMYQQEDFRALYYQNLEIIQLLKEIREEMRAVNLREAKAERTA